MENYTEACGQDMMENEAMQDYGINYRIRQERNGRMVFYGMAAFVLFFVAASWFAI